MQAQNFVKYLLSKDPTRRPNANKALSHPWFTGDRAPLDSSLELNKILANQHNSTLAIGNLEDRFLKSLHQNEAILVQNSILNKNQAAFNGISIAGGGLGI